MKLPSFIQNNLYALIAVASLLGVITSVYNNALLAIGSRKEEMRIRHSAIDLEYEMYVVNTRMNHLKEQIEQIARDNNLQASTTGTSLAVKGNLPADHALYRLTSELAEQENEVELIRGRMVQNRRRLDACTSGRDFAIVILELFGLFSYLVLYVVVKARNVRARTWRDSGF
jgi:predicted RNase H-like nuclease (RuvC/YqgF family)